MSLEEALKKLTETVAANTAAHEAHTEALLDNGKRVDRAIAVQEAQTGGKAGTTKVADTPASKTAAKTTTKKAAATAISQDELKKTAIAYTKLDNDEAAVSKRRAALAAYAKKTHEVERFTDIAEDERPVALKWLAKQTEAYAAKAAAADEDDDAGDDEEDDV